MLRAEGSFERVGTDEKAEGVGSAGDEDMRMNDGVEGAAFAVVDGDRQTAALFHCGEHQPVVVPVAENGDMTQVTPPRELAFFDALPFGPQLVWHDDSFELPIRGAVRIGRDDLEVDEFQRRSRSGLTPGLNLPW